LLEKVKDDSKAELSDTIHVLFESTVINSGYSVRNPKNFAAKIQNVIRKSLEMVEEDAKDAQGYAEEKMPDEEDPETKLFKGEGPLGESDPVKEVPKEETKEESKSESSEPHDEL
jgi:heat shock protein beta